MLEHFLEKNVTNNFLALRTAGAPYHEHSTSISQKLRPIVTRVRSRWRFLLPPKHIQKVLERRARILLKVESWIIGWIGLDGQSRGKASSVDTSFRLLRGVTSRSYSAALFVLTLIIRASSCLIAEMR